MRVLITGVGAGGVVSIIRALRSGLGDPYIVGVDAAPLAVGSCFVDRFCTVPLACDPNYVVEVYRLCRRERINVVIVSVDEEIAVLVREKDKFAGIGTVLALADAENVLLCLDKLRLCKTLETAGIPVPRTCLLGDWPYQEGERLILKPRTSRGSRGVRAVYSTGDFYYYKNRLEGDGYLAQEMIVGNEYTVDVLRNADGRFLATVPRLRVSTKSGMSIKGITVRDLTLIQLTQKAVDVVGLYGACNVQWIVDGLGRPWLIEINPRLAGTVCLSVEAGANIPAELVKLFGIPGYKGTPMDFREGVTMLRYWEACFLPGSGSAEGS